MTGKNVKSKVMSIADKKFETKELGQYRKALLTNVNGSILELGIGTGANLQYYPSTVKHITSVDVFVQKLRGSKPEVDHYYGTYQELPFENESFDTVVTTFTLSNVMELKHVLEEIRRVLKPRGRLIFMECGKAKTGKSSAAQEILNPIYEILMSTSINRDYFKELKDAGYIIANEVCTDIHVTPKYAYGTVYMGIALKVE